MDSWSHLVALFKALHRISSVNLKIHRGWLLPKSWKREQGEQQVAVDQGGLRILPSSQLPSEWSSEPAWRFSISDSGTANQVVANPENWNSMKIPMEKQDRWAGMRHFTLHNKHCYELESSLIQGKRKRDRIWDCCHDLWATNLSQPWRIPAQRNLQGMAQHPREPFPAIPCPANVRRKESNREHGKEWLWFENKEPTAGPSFPKAPVGRRADL